MSLDPQCRVVLDLMAAAGGRPIEELSVAEGRAQFAAAAEGRRALGGPQQDVFRIENRLIGSLPVRVYWPSAQENLPLLLYFHGGGFVFGDLEMVDRVCRALANQAGCIVVSVDYRLAPEHKFPQPVEDAFLAAQYVSQHAKELGADPNRIVIGGDSAGGNLSAAVTLMARDKGGPKLAFQLLIYPVTDRDDDQPSFEEFREGYFLTRAGMRWFWRQYLQREEDGKNPLASPLKAGSLHGLPPAMVITAGCDPLRDQGEAYARRLKDAGVAVQLKRYEGAIHAFFHMGGVIDSGKAALADAAQALRQV